MKSSKLEHGAEGFRENGQGILEYSVIIVLVVIILISFVSLFGVDLFNRFISNRARASEEQTTQASPEPVVNLYETGTDVELVETESIRASNCSEGEPYNPLVERTLGIEYDIELAGQVPASLRSRSITSIQTYYGFTAGERKELQFLLNLEAPLNSMVDYTIDWQRVWKEGTIDFTYSDNTQQSINYRAIVDLDYEITQIDQTQCESTPVP
jgi:type II secretory pathway pseudopilin PulG